MRCKADNGTKGEIMKPLVHIGLIAFERKKAIEEVVQFLLSSDEFSKNRFYACQKAFPFRIKGIKPLPEKTFLQKIEALVSFGGDGTFISAARLAGGSGVPLIGVNMGSLGFLTDIPAISAPQSLKAIFGGAYSRETRLMFDVAVKRKGKVIVRDLCLNDVVIRANRLFNLSVYCGKELVSAYNADGMIAATPTGSTAYSMAAGGPIVYPTLDCVILTPICSHSLTQKPMVSSIGEPITLRIEDNRAKLSFLVDGKGDYGLCEDDEVELKRSAFRTMLLKPRDITYFKILRRKLNWGRD